MPDRGVVADYIAPLAEIDPARFGMAVVEADGTCHLAGDAEEPFSIQSVAKVFGLTLALGLAGDALWKRVGREPGLSHPAGVAQGRQGRAAGAPPLRPAIATNPAHRVVKHSFTIRLWISRVRLSGAARIGLCGGMQLAPTA
eukprot:gene9829-13260_t